MNSGLHPVVLRAPRFLGGGDAPAVLRTTEQRFVQMLFEQLRHPELREQIKDKLLPPDDPTLYLPVHRTFQVVLAEAYCDIPGRPRVDPSLVAGAGLVIRRRMPGSGDQYAPPERWLTEPGAVMGWRTDAALDEDPEAAQRPAVSAGNPAIDRALTARRGVRPDVSESVTRLFVMPPDICEAVGATLLFGIVQPASPERAQPGGLTRTAEPTTPTGGTYTESEVRSLIPGWLRSSQSARSIPSKLRGFSFRVVPGGNAGVLVQREVNGVWEDYDVVDPWKPLATPAENELLQAESLLDERHFMRMLSQLQLQWNTFAQGPSPLRSTLEGVSVQGGGTLASRLEQAAAVFILRSPDATVTIPNEWPLISQSVGDALKEGVGSALQSALNRAFANEGRFDRPQARYELRAFVRVRRHVGCPPDLVWSDTSSLLRVARWYEGSPEGAVLPTMELPRLDRDLFAKIRPNINIRVPPDIFNFLQNNEPKDFVSGDAKDDRSGPSIMWLCSFNFSIIFIIAFMILINFVFLLNFVFWWVPFFRICIPLPAGMFSEGES